LNIDRREQATPDDLEQTVGKVLEDWGSHFHNLWNRSDNEQRACLIALLKQNHADPQQLAQTTGLNETITRRTLQRLHQRDLVLREQDGTYSIAVPMFRRWLELNT
jgi:DNA phosphorothioation-dependent restriction protein DptG